MVVIVLVAMIVVVVIIVIVIVVAAMTVVVVGAAAAAAAVGVAATCAVATIRAVLILAALLSRTGQWGGEHEVDGVLRGGQISRQRPQFLNVVRMPAMRFCVTFSSQKFCARSRFV